MPVTRIATSPGTKTSAPPKTEITLILVSPTSKGPSVKSIRVPPNTDTAVCPFRFVSFERREEWNRFSVVLPPRARVRNGEDPPPSSRFETTERLVPHDLQNLAVPASTPHLGQNIVTSYRTVRLCY